MRVNTQSAKKTNMNYEGDKNSGHRNTFSLDEKKLATIEFLGTSTTTRDSVSDRPPPEIQWKGGLFRSSCRTAALVSANWFCTASSCDWRECTVLWGGGGQRAQRVPPVRGALPPHYLVLGLGLGIGLNPLG